VLDPERMARMAGDFAASISLLSPNYSIVARTFANDDDIQEFATDLEWNFEQWKDVVTAAARHKIRQLCRAGGSVFDT
jgi:hypothetical protein